MEANAKAVDEAGSNLPTEKQVRFAEAISRSLGVPLPKKRTRQSLFLFIRDNRDAFDRRQTFEDYDPDNEWAYPSLEDTF